jgi:adenylosuccinate synthase
VREYAKLPAEAKKFVENIEGETGLKVTLIGTGPELYDVVDRRP